MKYKAFTLAEVLIVLVIIGVLTMILLPMAFQSSPDEKVMKFKKANNTLNTVIRELVSSDEYYQNGDLGIRKNGQLIDGSNEDDAAYFCKTIADLMNTKIANCNDYKGIYTNSKNSYINVIDGKWGNRDISASEKFDSDCKDYTEAAKTETITTQDGVIYYDNAPNTLFGSLNKENITQEENGCLNSGGGSESDCSENGRKFFWKHDGFYMNYKVFCIDIDGINKGEDPFGYGIRVDGKILPGARANEWMNKKINK